MKIEVTLTWETRETVEVPDNWEQNVGDLLEEHGWDWTSQNAELVEHDWREVF